MEKQEKGTQVPDHVIESLARCLLPKIQASLPAIVAHEVEVVAQGEIVARSLQDYLRRHTDIAATLSQGATCTYLTTEQADKFSESASLFLRTPVNAHHVVL